MTQQFLLGLISPQLLVPLGLLLISFILGAMIILKLGLRILKADNPLKVILPGALLLGSFNLFVKPFLSIGFVTFLIPIVSIVLALKFYSKSRIIICTWVSFLLLISTTLGPLLVISPLAASDPAAKAFFFENPYGVMISGLIEDVGPAVLLLMLSLFKLEIIPRPGQLLSRVDFYDIYLFLGLVYFCYRFTMYIWTAVQNGSRLALLLPLIDWMVSASVVLVYYLKKVHDQKKNERMVKEYEDKQAEMMSRIEEQALINSQGKSIEVNLLYDILNDFNYKTKNINKLILRVIKSQNQPARSNSKVHPGELDPREAKIARLIAMGKSNKEIGDLLEVAEGTAKALIAALQKKLGLEGREQIAVYAAQNNLLDNLEDDDETNDDSKVKSS